MFALDDARPMPWWFGAPLGPTVVEIAVVTATVVCVETIIPNYRATVV